MLNIHIIGLGGTGSWLMNLLLRNAELSDHNFDLFDFDTIEHKNVARQDFKNSHIGLYKVDCVAYIDAYNNRRNNSQSANRCNVTRHTTTYNPKNVPDIVISCIDTIAGRNEICRTLVGISKISDKRIVLMDSGNEDTYGQIMTSIFNKANINTSQQYIDLLNRPQHEVRGQGNVSCVDFEEQTATINFHQAAAIYYILNNTNIRAIKANILFTGSYLNSACKTVNNKYETFLGKLPKKGKAK